MKRNFNLLILILILFLLIFIIIFIVKYFKIKESFSDFDDDKFFSYYRCNDKVLGKITNNIFEENNIINSNEDWNIYIPCGYNDVEDELKKIIVKDNIKEKFIFGLNGCDSIVSKNRIWESLVNCYGRKDATDLMPESYVLSNMEEMLIFSKDYNPLNIYILKKNVQRKEGLKLTKDYYEIITAKNENYRVVQKYIRNLYLINQRKINLRIYLLVIIKNNFIYFYLCKIGKCIYTNKKYDDNDFDFESNITSYNLDMSVYKENPRHFTELIEYINLNGDDGNYLFNKIEDLMKKISYCLSKNFYQSKNILGSTCFQLFGADVIFDTYLHPYLLEINKGPDMSPRDSDDERMKNNVQSDMFKTVGILKNDDNNSFYLIYKNSI